MIIFIDEMSLILKPADSNTRVYLTRCELDTAYLNGNVIDADTKTGTITEDDSDFILSDLSLNQRRIINIRLEFIHEFIHENVSIKNDADIVEQIAKKLNMAKIPGVSTVRRWVTNYRKSGENPASLIDNRSRLVAE